MCRAAARSSGEPIRVPSSRKRIQLELRVILICFVMGSNIKFSELWLREVKRLYNDESEDFVGAKRRVSR